MFYNIKYFYLTIRLISNQLSFKYIHSTTRTTPQNAYKIIPAKKADNFPSFCVFLRTFVSSFQKKRETAATTTARHVVTIRAVP